MFLKHGIVAITESLNHCIETCVVKIKHPPNKKHNCLNWKAIKLRHEKVASYLEKDSEPCTRNHLDYLRFTNKRN